MGDEVGILFALVFFKVCFLYTVYMIVSIECIPLRGMFPLTFFI